MHCFTNKGCPLHSGLLFPFNKGVRLLNSLTPMFMQRFVGGSLIISLGTPPQFTVL